MEQSAPLVAEQVPPSPRRGADQRQDERYVVHGDAEIFVTGGTSMFRGRILNISVSGCYVQTVAWARPAPGTLVELLFVVKGMWCGCGRRRGFRSRRSGWDCALW